MGGQTTTSSGSTSTHDADNDEIAKKTREESGYGGDRDMDRTIGG